MFANFTEETCTGTGDTLALSGATTGNLTFSASFGDGERVAYTLEDAAGSIKISGVGNYVAATNSITRGDMWNYDGTQINEAITTNITLTGGTHTIRCSFHQMASSGGHFATPPGGWQRSQIGYNLIETGNFWQSANPGGANNLSLYAMHWPHGLLIEKMIINVASAGGAGEIAKAGVWTYDGRGIAGKLITETANYDVSTSGFKIHTLGTPIYLKPGYYYTGLTTDSATATFDALNGGRGEGVHGRESASSQDGTLSQDIGTAWQTGSFGDDIDSRGNAGGVWSVPVIRFNGDNY